MSIPGPMSSDPHGNDRKSIVLTGFMGTGKSTVGRIVAEALAIEFVDTDAVIEERHGPIPEIFERSGEDGFRDLERALARELAADQHVRVIATGGRMMLDPANVEALAPVATILCLVADPDELVARLLASAQPGEKPGHKRPLLDTPDPEARIRDLLEERAAGYGAFPQIDAGRPRGDVAADVIERSGLSVERRPPR